MDALGDGNGTNMSACAHAPSDNFDSSTDCGTWGTRYGSAAPFERDNQRLKILPTFDPSYCRTTQSYVFTNGASIEIPQIASSMATTYFRIISAANQAQYMSVVMDDSSGSGMATTHIECNGLSNFSTMYDSGSDRWWKFDARAAALGNSIHASHSANGTSFTDVGAPCAWSDASSVIVDMGVGGTTYGAATAALFDNFNIKTCPP
jgi:hypothetical protein